MVEKELLKDVLFVYDSLLGEPGLVNGNVEIELLDLPYWKYTNLSKNRDLFGDMSDYLNIVTDGCLIILISKLLESTDLVCRRNFVLPEYMFLSVEQGVKNYIVSNENQYRLKETGLLGLKVYSEAKIFEDEYEHDDSAKLYMESCWINENYIKSHFLDLLSKYLR